MDTLYIYEKLDFVECNLSWNNHIQWRNWWPEKRIAFPDKPKCHPLLES